MSKREREIAELVALLVELRQLDAASYQELMDEMRVLVAQNEQKGPEVTL